MKHYDLIIIGSGGGTKLRPAAELGKKVAIIEKSELGGACLNRGCIPSKMLIYPSDLATHIREDAKKLHIHRIEDPKIDFKTLSRDIVETVKKDSHSIEKLYDSKENITLYRGHAHFISNTVISVNDEEITAKKIYVATGSVPKIPDIDGLHGTPYMTSTEAIRTDILPERVIVIGGGYIAVELGHVFGASGSQVDFVVRSNMISAEDTDIREVFEKDFSERYNVHKGWSPIKVSYEDKLFTVIIKNKTGTEMSLEAEGLLVATGVQPMTERLGLENTDIKVSDKGYIVVDEYLQTHATNVYALGDVIGNYLFRHSVNFEGEYLYHSHYIDPKNQKPIKYPSMPHAIFSYPQIAGVGVTEDELIDSEKVLGADYEVGVHYYKNSAMGSAMKSEVGFVKLIGDKHTKKLIGAHVLGEKASDIIHMLIVIISARLPVSFMIEDMIFIHPALSEVIRNAARTLHCKLEK